MSKCENCELDKRTFNIDIWWIFWNWTVDLCDECMDLDDVQDKWI